MLVLKIDKIITEISINYSEFRSWKVTMSRITNDIIHYSRTCETESNYLQF